MPPLKANNSATPVVSYYLLLVIDFQKTLTKAFYVYLQCINDFSFSFRASKHLIRCLKICPEEFLKKSGIKRKADELLRIASGICNKKHFVKFK